MALLITLGLLICFQELALNPPPQYHPQTHRKIICVSVWYYKYRQIVPRTVSGAVDASGYRSRCCNRALSLNVSIVGGVPSSLETSSYVEVNVAIKCDARNLLAME